MLDLAGAATPICDVKQDDGRRQAMVAVRCLRPLLGALLPVALAAQELPRRVEPERLWKLDTGG